MSNKKKSQDKSMMLILSLPEKSKLSQEYLQEEENPFADFV
jgi:hypothetical protein